MVPPAICPTVVYMELLKSEVLTLSLCSLFWEFYLSRFLNKDTVTFLFSVCPITTISCPITSYFLSTGAFLSKLPWRLMENFLEGLRKTLRAPVAQLVGDIKNAPPRFAE